MISRLRGTVWESKPLKLVIDVGGVGYEVSVPLTDRLPPVGQTVELHTHAVYREDSATLYGFEKPQERDFFILLVEKVTGIGPKTALGLLNHLPLGRLMSAIESGDVNALKAAPGIGKKTAERLLLELKGQSVLAGSATPLSGPLSDAAAALVSLGYTPLDAHKTVQKLSSELPKATTNELVKAALKKD